EIARLFRVPPHLISDLEQATFSNIEQQSLEFVIYTMMPWFTRWEQEISRSILLESERARYFAEFLIDSLLRGDTASRFAAYTTAINAGWMTRNEVREKENLNQDNAQLDKYLVPLNMGIVGEPPAIAPNSGQTLGSAPTDATSSWESVLAGNGRH
ncbi:MAG: phage portal protein, partial [Deltaproteobacteria bacterium]